MGALTVIAPKLGKLIPLLATEHDGEVLATVGAIRRTLGSAGLDLHDLVNALNAPPAGRSKPKPTRREPESWFQLTDFCLDWPGLLTEKEGAFLRDIGLRLVMGAEPTERQAAWLRSIYAKVVRAAV